MSRRPLIAVTTAEFIPADARGRVDRLAVPRTYLRAISAAGGIPLTCWTAPEDAEQVAGTVDGLLVCGGPDVNASMYGSLAHPSMTAPAEPVADAFEAALLSACERRGLPILAICRGMQLLNVCRGGTLHQHIPDLPGANTHSSPPGAAFEHPLDLDVGTRLSALVGAAAMTANTYHHQAVNALGHGLRVTATASDGIVEAIEDVAHPFLVGVQWHPEALQHRPEHRRLVDAFVSAC